MNIGIGLVKVPRTLGREHWRGPAMASDLSELEELLEAERQERLRWWQNWVNQPAPIQIIFRLKPTVFLSKLLPPEIKTHEDAEAFACAYARQHRVRLCLVLSRRRSVWINSDGLVEARYESTPDCPDRPLLRLVGSISTFLVE